MNERIENTYIYHPADSTQEKKYNHIRVKAKELAYIIEEECPDSREKSLAMTKLEEASMWANASIARN